MFRTVIFDFYGTLARATTGCRPTRCSREHGVRARSRAPCDTTSTTGIDGVEHDEHSQSRDHYVAWQRQRMLSMLAETDVHPGEYEVILEKLRAGSATRVLEATTRSLDVLGASPRPRPAPRHLLELGLGPARGGRRVRAHRRWSTRSCRRRGRAPASPTRGSSTDTLAEAGVEAAEDALRRRHVGARRRGPARRPACAGVPRPRRATGPTGAPPDPAERSAAAVRRRPRGRARRARRVDGPTGPLRDGTVSGSRPPPAGGGGRRATARFMPGTDRTPHRRTTDLESHGSTGDAPADW